MPRLQSEFKQTPITAVTATATREVQADILATLGITRSVTVHQVCVCVSGGGGRVIGVGTRVLMYVHSWA